MLFWECRLVVWCKGCTRLMVSPSYWKYISQLWALSKQVPHRLIYLNTLSSVGGIAMRDHRTIRRWSLTGESFTGGGLWVLKPHHFLFSLPAFPTTMDSISPELYTKTSHFFLKFLFESHYFPIVTKVTNN